MLFGLISSKQESGLNRVLTDATMPGHYENGFGQKLYQNRANYLRISSDANKNDRGNDEGGSRGDGVDDNGGRTNR